MLPQYGNRELIANIKRRCTVPTSQLTYTEEDFCLLANDVLQDQVVPLMMTAREEYFLDFYDVVADSDGRVDFPVASIGAKLRSVCELHSSLPLRLTNISRIDLDVLSGPDGSSGFYIENNQVVLTPLASFQNKTIRLYFYQRALVLAEPDAYGQIVSVDTGSLTVVLDSVPSDWIVGTELNSVSSTPHFKTTNALMVVTALSAPSVVLDSVTDVSVGDYLSGLGFSGVPQIPLEAHAYLAQITASLCLESLGDRDGAKMAAQTADVLKVGLLSVISQRVDGSTKKIVNPYGLRNSRIRRR